MKSIDRKKLEVYFYLAPSKISGIGVFSRVEFKKGEKIDKFITDDAVFIKKSDDVDLLNKSCVKVKNGWWCPSDFSRPSFWWYINNSKKPNVNYNEKKNEFIVDKDINPGEEITIDYKALDEETNNSNVKFFKKSPKSFYQ